MRYEWTSNGSTIRGQLDARQVADMAAAGMSLEVVREYRCTRGSERHWGEHTQSEIDALTADGWACEVGEPWPMEVPAPPDPSAILAARAAEVLANPDAVEAVQAVLARVGEVVAAGVAITDWTYQGVTAAIEGAMTGDASHDLALMRYGMALRTSWDRVIYHAGTMQTAQELWPAMVATVTSETPSA